MNAPPDPYRPASEPADTEADPPERSFRFLALAIAFAPTLALVLSGMVARPRFVAGFANMVFQLFTSWLFIFPLSLPLAGWLTWLCVRAGLHSSPTNFGRLHWLAIPAATPLFLLAWGVVFRHSHRSVYPDWQNDAILWVLIACLFSSIFAVLVNDRHRWIAIAGSCNCCLLSFGAAFLAGMSVTGEELDALLPDRWLQSHPDHAWTMDTIRRKERQAKETHRRQKRRR